MRFCKKNLCNLGSVFFEGLRMTHWRSKHVTLTIYYFNVYEINCCVMDWHTCVFYKLESFHWIRGPLINSWVCLVSMVTNRKSQLKKWKGAVSHNYTCTMCVIRRLRKISKSNYQLRRVCPSNRPHGTIRLPLDGFSWNLIFQ